MTNNFGKSNELMSDRIPIDNNYITECHTPSLNNIAHMMHDYIAIVNHLLSPIEMKNLLWNAVQFCPLKSTYMWRSTKTAHLTWLIHVLWSRLFLNAYFTSASWGTWSQKPTASLIARRNTKAWDRTTFQSNTGRKVVAPRATQHTSVGNYIFLRVTGQFIGGRWICTSDVMHAVKRASLLTDQHAHYN
jgi:hypothetical protein